MKLGPHSWNLAYNTGIMLDNFHAYYAQTYAGVLAQALLLYITLFFVLIFTLFL